ncbi:MAG: hypothetical protein L0G94_10580, partial [Brachybacterium sp.]|uniref:hypothetical protein n=1 Tax=Brachybacterium sp. TaxID=1891286 RepID=UPI00264905CD
MTNFGPRCPALHPDLPHSRCGLSEGHVGTHRNFTGNEWTDAPDYYEKLASALRNVRTDLADGGVTCAAIENEAKGRYVSSEEVAAYWHDRADKAERALADVHERDETVARL